MRPKLLLTGASGFIGSQIYKELENDFDITALTTSSASSLFTNLNLLDSLACEEFFKNRKFHIIIHAAAIAHGKNKVNNMSVENANILMTENIFKYLDTSESKVIFLSSVSVYSYKNNKKIISINDIPIPVTKYGKSKLKCEEIIRDQKPKYFHTLRLSPVYTEKNLQDISKRVFLPIFKSSFITKQERSYTLCHMDIVTKKIKDLIQDNSNSLLIVKDSKDHDQKDLLAYFKIDNPNIIINRNLLKPLLFLLNVFQFSKTIIIRDMLEKLFFSVKYTND
ncbi:NAD(P)-dependent oxidoreductase [Chryseobacterium sp. C39-AII1]|uniref:NAD(P)-dependent oxidoreductase n=1 Tax=Chryseobacterium sp. C39-AII1 TaxID=3080332 RepID=UPI00320A82F2